MGTSPYFAHYGETGTIGKAKLKRFWRPDISGRPNSNVFGVPIYREGKTQMFLAIPYRQMAKLKRF